MATFTRNEENLVERDEVVFPSTDVIDTEPHYSNFTTIQNVLRQREQQQQTQMNITTHSRSYSSDDLYRAIRTPIEPSTLQHSSSTEMLYMNTHPSSYKYTVPIDIQSKKIDGHIFNLTQIVEDIGYNRNTPFIRSSSSSSNSNTKNVSALLDIVLKMGGAHGPLTNSWRSRITNDDYQRWYLEKYHQRSASTTKYNNLTKTTTFDTQTRDHQSNNYVNHSAFTRLPYQQVHIDQPYDNEIKQIYGYDEMDSASTTSSQSSYSEIELKHLQEQQQQQRAPSITSILKKNHTNSPNSPNSTSKHRVKIREDFIKDDYNQTMMSKQQNNQRVLSKYQQIIQDHPEVYKDPNPEVIIKPNPEQVTYQQNVSVRYLVPPTPPPPGPLIIREIVPPRAPSPPPLIVKYQEPSPPTPPPLILREAPPPPPPHQETTIITKVLSPEPQSPRRIIVEHDAPAPAKPQQVIIEKWLPYKPAPPREVIYERVTDTSTTTEIESPTVNTERHRRHSADYQNETSRIQIPVNYEQYHQQQQQQQQQQQHYQRRNSTDQHQQHYQRRNSTDQYQQQQISQQSATSYDQLAWETHQQILELQKRGQQQVRAHQQWAAQQWQQHANMFSQCQTQLTTPSLIVYHPPVTTAYIETQEYQQKQIQYNPTYIYPYF